ncbi:MAG TPA: radical SAM protein [Kamptonema sp.]|nr:radical SAM protein [Kamptonema sp.]
MPKDDIAPTIGLVELPHHQLIDADGISYSTPSIGMPLISKQVLLASLQAGGFDAQLVNLQAGNESEEYGTVTWREKALTKKYAGTKISNLDPEAYDVWGVTSNFTEYRDLALKVVKYLADGSKPVVVGGSDALAVPQLYLQAGAKAVVTDKSGAANWAIFDDVLGRESRSPLSGVILADGRQYPKSNHPLSPEDWPLPSLEVVKQCLGTKYKEGGFQGTIRNVGSVVFDIGCDRKCDFCQTPTYGTGYRRMSPKRALEWCALQKEAGADFIVSASDQFLGRVLFPEGTSEVLEIVNGMRQMELGFAWNNGIEIRKATKGRGRNYDNTDLAPDRELVEAVWGYDGKVGCLHAYIPAERPFAGRDNYKKLLPWHQHCEMVRAIVETGVPDLAYGVIIGMPEDNHDSYLYLEEAVWELSQELKILNPQLKFFLAPLTISPLPGTPQDQNLRQLRLLHYDDPAVIGGLFSVCSDTLHLSYEEVSDWQMRLFAMNAKINSGTYVSAVHAEFDKRLVRQK